MEIQIFTSEIERKANKIAKKLFNISGTPIYVYSDKTIIALDYEKYDETKNPIDEWYEKDGFYVLLTKQSDEVISVEFIGLTQISNSP